MACGDGLENVSLDSFIIVGTLQNAPMQTIGAIASVHKRYNRVNHFSYVAQY